MINKKKIGQWSDLIISISLLIIIWQLYVTKANIPSFMLPKPMLVFKEILNQITSIDIWKHLFITAFGTLTGFAFATFFGLIIGYFIFKNKTIRITLMPFLIFFQVAPKIALVPIFIIWFGLGLFSKLFVVFSMAFFPIVIGMIDGMTEIPKEMYDFMTILNADKKQILREVEIPYALPFILAAAKVGIIQAIIGAIVAEWISGQSGLGYIQTYAASTFNTPLLIAGIFFTVILGLFLYTFIGLLETNLLDWNILEEEK